MAAASATLLRSGEFCERLGINVAMLNRWIRDDLIVVVDGGGSGNPWRIPASELVVARALLGWSETRSLYNQWATIAAAARDAADSDPSILRVALSPDALVVLALR